MGVREQLASLGEDLGKFSQEKFRGTTTSVNGADLTKGYCAGVCLDWTRRVLLSGSGRDAKFLTYAKQPQGSQRQVKAVKRMGASFAGQGASYVTTTKKEDYIAGLTDLLSKPDETVEWQGETVTGVAVPNYLAEQVTQRHTLNPNPFDLGFDPAGWVTKTRITNWKNSVSSQADPQLQKLAAGGRKWAPYANQLDTAHTQGKKRKFRDLVVIASADQQTYASEGVWSAKLRTNAFENTRCTIIGLGAPGKEGHAVAVHVVGDDYRFFDPNYGAFKYTKEKLMSALQYLFWAPYWTNEAGLDAATHPVYRRREKQSDPIDNSPWTQMSYTVFGKNA